ncbi:MAG: hypothetical protein SH856_03100 [Flavobacteriales bacterium]|nr:hypothetical protein [Flavobacteriales bacterium]
MKTLLLLLLLLSASATILSQDILAKQDTVIVQDTVELQITDTGQHTVVNPLTTSDQDTLVKENTVIIKQDTVLTNSGEEFFGIVTEVTPSHIVCQVNNNAEVINRVILLEDVFMIKYAKGTRELITQTKAEVIAVGNLSPAEMRDKGKSDAKLYYKGTGAKWGSAVTTAIYPPFGLVETLVSAAVKPQIKREQVSDVNLLNDKNYVEGYKKQAHKMKVGKVFGGFGIGLATFTTLVVVVVAATL